MITEPSKQPMASRLPSFVQEMAQMREDTWVYTEKQGGWSRHDYASYVVHASHHATGVAALPAPPSIVMSCCRSTRPYVRLCDVDVI